MSNVGELVKKSETVYELTVGNNVTELTKDNITVITTDPMAKVEKDERIAQLVVAPFLKVDFNIVDDLDETDRGEGGFGSTGTK